MENNLDELTITTTKISNLSLNCQKYIKLIESFKWVLSNASTSHILNSIPGEIKRRTLPSSCSSETNSEWTHFTVEVLFSICLIPEMPFFKVENRTPHHLYISQRAKVAFILSLNKCFWGNCVTHSKCDTWFLISTNSQWSLGETMEDQQAQCKLRPQT